MNSSSRAPTPAVFHGMFSFAVGLLVPRWIHHHELVPLILGNAIWAGSFVFIRARARLVRGVFLDEEAELFYWLGATGYLAGLLLVSTYYVVFG